MVGTGIQQGGRADLIRCKMYVLPRNQLVITCPISPPFLFTTCLFLSNLPSSLPFLAFDLFSKHCKMACTVPLNMCCSKLYTVLKCSSPTTCTNSLLLQAEPHCRLQGALLLLPGRLSSCFHLNTLEAILTTWSLCVDHVCLLAIVILTGSLCLWQLTVKSINWWTESTIRSWVWWVQKLVGEQKPGIYGKVHCDSVLDKFNWWSVLTSGLKKQRASEA